jgi:hypothetical protein
MSTSTASAAYPLPQYQVGFPERAQSIARRAAAHSGLVLAGTALGAVGLPDCIRSGLQAAEAAWSHSVTAEHDAGAASDFAGANLSAEPLVPRLPLDTSFEPPLLGGQLPTLPLRGCRHCLLTLTSAVAVSVWSLASRTVSVTVYVPALGYLCETVRPRPLFPSPKFHR